MWGENNSLRKSVIFKEEGEGNSYVPLQLCSAFLSFKLQSRNLSFGIQRMNLTLFFIAEDSCKKYEETLSTEQEPTVE